MTTRHERITAALKRELGPAHLEVVDESSAHNVPAGAESHFRIVVVAGIFDGMGAVERHRRVYQLLAEELARGLHAVSLHTHSPAEWALLPHPPASSPDCRGGGA